MAIAAMLASIIVGCGEQDQKPKVAAPKTEQIQLLTATKELSKQLEQVRAGNNEAATRTVENNIKRAIKSQSVTANGWVATVEKIMEIEDETVVLANYESSEFMLKLVSKDARSWATGLKSGDTIEFSGNMGKEASVTLDGALRNPEFRFYPAAIKLQNETKSQFQTDNDIAAAIVRITKKEEQDTLITYIKTLCEENAKARATVKRSVDFSLFNAKITQIDNSNWTYTNTVDGKNAFGTTFEYKMNCQVETRQSQSGKLQARIKSLRIVQ